MATKILAFPIAAVLFAVWAVYLGGLASLQSTCADNGTSNMVGVPSIDATLPCMKVYRLQWFYAAYEFFLVVVTALVAIPKLGGHLNMGVIGLLAVGVVLFIDASNTFLSAEELDFYSSGQPLHRIRTTTAGAIMVAVANGLAMLALGHTRTIETTVEKPASNV